MGMKAVGEGFFSQKNLHFDKLSAAPNLPKWEERKEGDKDESTSVFRTG
jgi:hypothetical protein